MPELKLPDCPYCKDARFLRFDGRLIPCDICNHREPDAPAPVEPTPFQTRAQRRYRASLEV